MSRVVLPDVDAIRARPAMYVGNTSEYGARELCSQAIGLCLNSVVRGLASRVDVTLHQDQSLSVQCDGPALPALEPSERTAEALTTALTEYRTPAGLEHAGKPNLLFWCGLLPPLNALSEWFEITVWERGSPLHLRFERGYPAPATSAPAGTPPAAEATRFHWRPDPTIFSSSRIIVPALRRRLELDAFLAAGVTVTLRDAESGRHWSYCHPEGPAALAEVLTTGSSPLGEPIRIEHDAEWGQLSVGLQYYVDPGRAYYSHSYWEDATGSVMYFANHRRLEWGTPAVAYWNAISRVWSDYLQKHESLPRPVTRIPQRALAQCARAVVSLRLPNPVWGGPVRQCLMNDDLEPALEEVIHAALAHSLPPLLDAHPWLVRHVHETIARQTTWPRQIERWR